MTMEYGPSVIRFPKGGLGAPIPAIRTVQGVDVIHAADRGDVLIVAVGSMVAVASEVARILDAHGIGATVVDPVWALPVPAGVIELARGHKLAVIIEDGLREGGIGAAVSQSLRDQGIDIPVRNFGIAREFLEQAKRADILVEQGLTAQDIARSVAELTAEHIVIIDESASGADLTR